MQHWLPPRFRLSANSALQPYGLGRCLGINYLRVLLGGSGIASTEVARHIRHDVPIPEVQLDLPFDSLEDTAMILFLKHR